MGRSWCSAVLEVVVVGSGEGACLLVFGNLSFEEVLFLFKVHGLGEPGEGVFDVADEGFEAAVDEATVGDVVDVLLEFFAAESDGADGEAVADEFFFEADAFLHGVAEILLELGGPDVGVLGDEGVEEVAEDFDVVGFVAQGVAEHLADAGEFVLAVEAENHAEEAVELGAFHDLAEHEDVFGEGLLVVEVGEVDVAAEGAAVRYHEVVLGLDGGDVLEHGFAFVWVDAEGGDHVDEGVGVDVFLVGVAAEDELELGGGDKFADDVENVVADDAFSGGEVADTHLDDPALDVGDVVALPLLDVGLHLDVLGLPVVVLHRLVEVVGPLVFEGEDVEEHGVATIDDGFGVDGGLGFVLVEGEGAVSDGVSGGIGGHFGWQSFCEL